ncbi:LPS export ABC transporter periplasmic protein LptC, partial [Sulfuricurvum sp.]|uniref:LPS export ABC transporter periplasmic protein LptC n=1 Tax=Sulfuricurvum sp. TaxID=2025608 RepID=UPI003BB66805
IELFSFALYEISHKGIEHVLEGKEGKKFDESYTVTSAKFSDNTQSLFQSLKSNNLDYRSNEIKLKGNVHYAREDGLEFHSNEGKYNTDTSVIQTQSAFIITKKSNRIDGKQLHYDNKNDTVSANHVRVSYQLE